jgi:hypothetical protein
VTSNTQVAAAIPIYRSSLEPDEDLAWMRLERCLGGYDWIAAAQEGLDLPGALLERIAERLLALAASRRLS